MGNPVSADRCCQCTPITKFEESTTKDSSASWLEKVRLFRLASFSLVKLKTDSSVSVVCRSSFLTL